MLLLLFNICFVLPLIGIVATLWFAGDHAEPMLAVGRNFLQRHWPVVLSGLALIAGVIVILLGATGIAGPHSRFSRFFHHLRHLLPIR
jgi:hypothetical protein